MTRAHGLAEAAGIIAGMLASRRWTGRQRSALVGARMRILQEAYAASKADEEHLADLLEERWEVAPDAK